MHLLGEPPLTFTKILMFRHSCAKFMFLSSEEVNKVVSLSGYCLQFPSLDFFAVFFLLVSLVRNICLVCFLVSLQGQGGIPMIISFMVEQIQDNCTAFIYRDALKKYKCDSGKLIKLFPSLQTCPPIGIQSLLARSNLNRNEIVSAGKPSKYS